MKQVVRIIGGRYRGKKLSFPDVEGLRPTPDRIRETLFNWLMHDIHNARCLDAFAGSGALGFEAFSRGAVSITMIEQSPKVYLHLQKQALSLPTSNVKIIQSDARHFLRNTKERFDLVFLDPPFSQNYLPECLAILEQSPILEPGGLLYLESNHELALNPEHWNKIKLKQAGQVVYGLYRKLI